MTELRVSLDMSSVAAIGEDLAGRLTGLRFDTSSATPDRWLRTREAAEYLAVSVSELHRLAAAGRIPHAQDGPGAALFFHPRELDAWRRGEA